jgi:hypothetical protein
MLHTVAYMLYHGPCWLVDGAACLTCCVYLSTHKQALLQLDTWLRNTPFDLSLGRVTR